ncbi:adenosine deaminase [Candidatus Uabimicrobium amorphum]|uniref:adenosine deaminase n=1 Tax=Uabimicrobium amorphum TaxID=2596890 RepID=A0A5S9F7R8_UABAM|nr:adenosine deaminase [Candidatus Uabimicrobium amorphum]BBM88029.1 adenosine deaminase [Candidatus Uabimicrobium amorphum]
MEITKQDILSLPKSELHCHLDGSVRINTIIDLAREYKIELPSYEESGLEKHLICGRKVVDLVEYLDAFRMTLSVMQDKDALERIAFELVEDAARENLWYFEVRFSPTLHDKKGLSYSEIVEAVLRGFAKGEAKYNIKVGLIICAMREKSLDEALEMARLCVKYYGKGVVAFDLAGAEAGNPAKKFGKAFAMIRKSLVNRTIHAGEAFGAKSIFQAIELGAHRIGHGISLEENEQLFQYVNNHRIAIEVCLKCNTQTGTPLEEHPLPRFVKKGLCVTLNTDNRLMSATTLTDEYMLAINTYSFSKKQVKELIINSFTAAFLPFDEKRQLLQKVEEKTRDVLGN